MIKTKLFDQELFPQFAYLPGRSAANTMHRVVSQCREVRHRNKRQIATIHTKRPDVVPSKYCGGAQLVLDMSIAFDREPREALVVAL